MDKEIVLAFINGPGPGLSFMVLGFFAMVCILAGIRVAGRNDFEQGKNAARREGLERLESSIARLINDQQEMRNERRVINHPEVEI